MKRLFQFLLGATMMILFAGSSYSLETALPSKALAAPKADKASASSVAEIAGYEQKFFERSFDGETKERRLDRLETFIFGAISKGTPQKRIARIAQVVPLPSSAPPKTSETPNTQQQKSSSVQTPPTILAAEPALESPGNYPHITALEAKILGDTYASQPLTERLSRLETKAFGTPSKSQDLEARTDAIDKYWRAKHRTKDLIIGTRPDDDDDEEMNEAASTTPRHYTYNAPEPINPRRYESADEDAGTIIKEQTIQQELADAQKTAAPTKEERTLSRIAWCEQQIFGHAFPEMHLLKRLHQLNHELYPTDTEPDIELMDRIDKIVKEVVLRKQPHQPTTT
jgi:hypothetical protein